MRGRYANPYANLGNSVGGIINAFTNRDIAKGAGFNAGASSQSGINMNNANIQKIMDELQRGQRGDAFTGDQMAIARGASESDIPFYDAMQASDGANFGPGVMPPGVAGPPAEFMTDRPASFTPQDEETIRSSRSARAAQTMGGKIPGMEQVMAALGGASEQGMMTDMMGATDTSVPGNVRDIMSAMKGSKNDGGGGALNMNDSEAVGSMLSKGDFAHYANALNEGASPQEALAAVVSYHTDINPKDILPALMKIDPMLILETLGKDPAALGDIIGTATGDFERTYKRARGGSGSKGKGTITYDVGGQIID